MKSFLLNQSYFNSSDAKYDKFYKWGSKGFTADKDWYRLKLDEVLQKSNGLSQSMAKIIYKSEMSDPCNACESHNIYSLPPRFAHGSDHYGYFNAPEIDQAGEPMQKKKYIPTLTNKNGSLIVNGVSKSPVEEYSQAGLIESIIFPSGGYTTYEFETNKHENGVLIGGNRVKSIISNNGSSSADLVETFKYFDAHEFATPNYYYFTYINNYNYYIHTNSTDAQHCETASAFLFSDSFTNLFDLNGSFIGYGTVHVETSAGGKTIYKYNTIEDYPDEEYTLDVDNEVDFGDRVISDTKVILPNNYMGPPFSPNTSKFWKRGTIKSQEIQDESGSKIESKEYEYNNGTFSYVRVNKRIKEMFHNVYRQNGVFIICEYQDTSSPFTLANITSNIHSEINPNNSTQTKQEYLYNNSKPTLLSKIITTLPNGDQTRETYTYPFNLDVTCSGCENDKLAIYELEQNNVYSVISTTVKQKKSNTSTWKFLGAEVNVPTNFGESTKQYVLGINSPTSYYTDISFNGNDMVVDSDMKLVSSTEYDSETLNPINKTDKDGIRTEYTYSHNNTLIKTQKIGSFISTYDYKPLIGFSKVTSHNGNFMTYHYDPLNRLQFIKDENSDILEVYRHHYANQDYTPTATFDISGLNKPNENVTFQYTGPEPMNGTNRYVWDFGDGNIDESSARTIQHQYSIAGEYSPSLTVINAEYDENPQQSLPINIYDTPYDFTIANTDGSAGLGYVVEATGVLGYSCGNPQFSWKYRISGAWLNLPVSGYEVLIDVAEGETWQVQLHVVDDCDVSATSNIITLVGPEEGGSDPSQN